MAIGPSLLVLAAPLAAEERYRERPPVIVSPDLTAPWIRQLGGQVRTARPTPSYPSSAGRSQTGLPGRPLQLMSTTPRVVAPPTQSTQLRPRPPEPPLPASPSATAPVQAAAMQPIPVIRSRLEPQFLPQIVDYETRETPGTIVIDTPHRFLYLVMEGGKAKRYGVGVGKPGFEWAGAHKVTRKAEWPDWHPPKEMIAREAAKGHYLPVKMDGGPENPLGARALYLGSTLYRIHGTNAPWTIGSGVSSGCIRMRNEDVTDLYQRVPVGTTVIVM
ncbi:L,D-transpeptidase [Rhizobium sp. CSW-27]|uniref:L,D-transpeptidase n=1 Tax=Rhizobium sp. CSW-27 TaxID=2839985 RepID=UPI001C015DEC|nr:L,D-transpeptidase [Rhizobium sp. CSW-27]MBT9368943.1 L,D-transpeptidase [Rhizobium sp. CSW-27]